MIKKNSRLSSIFSSLGNILILILFIITHIGIGYIIYYDTSDYLQTIAYTTIIVISLLLGIWFGFKTLLKIVATFLLIFILSWGGYSYYENNIKTCPTDSPLRSTSNICYSCDTPKRVTIKDPTINPCPNRKIDERHRCHETFYVSSLTDLPDEIFDTILYKCLEKPTSFHWLVLFSVGIIFLSFYLTLWALLLNMIRKKFYKKTKRMSKFGTIRSLSNER